MVKKFILFGLSLLYSTMFYAQTYSYDHLGILFSKEDYRGSARYNAMGGAFGALGGDVSALYVNPAGGAVFSQSEISGALVLDTKYTNTKYYGTLTDNEYYNINIEVPHFGAVFVFDNPDYSSFWKKFSFGLNYSITNDFSNAYRVKGNNDLNIAYSIEDDPTSPYNQTVEQVFKNEVKGYSSVFGFSFSSAYKDRLYLGASINLHEIDFFQNTSLEEINQHETVDSTQVVSYGDYLSELSQGISLGIGLISRPTNHLRLGLSYRTPIWFYEISEEDDYNYLDYSLRTPGKLTASMAYIFNQYGLISLDYATANFQNVYLSGPEDFSAENNDFKMALNNRQQSVHLGTEWRLKQWSIRGGYLYRENPLKQAFPSDHTRGFSTGIGYKSGDTKFDVSYEKTSHTDFYGFYGAKTAPAELDIDQSKITFGLSFVF